MLLKIPISNNVYFVSDPHFAHTNICKATSKWSDTSICRDYQSLEIMNEQLIHMMNEAKEDDTIICLGDWAFGGYENVVKFRKNIRCQNIYLILGNHDHHIENNKDGCQALFRAVSYYARIEIGDNVVVCSHYPITSWHNMNKGWYHLHGHVHLKPQHAIHAGKAMDVGVDGMKKRMTMYEWGNILGLLSNHPNKILTLPSDHHEKKKYVN